jgi:hypothetical protein
VRDSGDDKAEAQFYRGKVNQAGPQAASEEEKRSTRLLRNGYPSYSCLVPDRRPVGT